MEDLKDIKFLSQEREDLNLHIDLCAQRYYHLESRLSAVESKIDNLAATIAKNQKELHRIIIGTAGTIIPAILGLIATLLMR